MTYQFYAERPAPQYQHFKLAPASGALGGLVSGIDLNRDLSDEAFEELYSAFLDFKVLFFRQQAMSPEQHIAFARRFGIPQGPGAVPTLEGYPQIKEQIMDEYSTIGSDVNFHADDSFRDYPSKLSILRGLTMPQGGGNTIWCDMEKAYDSLSEPMKAFLEGLNCEHNLDKTFGRGILEGAGAQAWEDMMKRNPPTVHPLIVTHPETGRKSIYASQLTGVRIPELSAEESQVILDMLLRHAYQPEFQCRFSWEDDSIALWDNRCLQHRGINDFSPAYRQMHRIAICGTLRPSRDPSAQTPLSLDLSRDYVNVDELYEVKPEMSYNDGSYQNTENQPVQLEAENSDDNAKVDPGFLAKLNAKKDGFSFTPGAAAQLKRIPAMFRGAALRAIFKEAASRNQNEINVALLNDVNRKRKGV